MMPLAAATGWARSLLRRSSSDDPGLSPGQALASAGGAE
jgi:hypothetical protein